MDSIIISTTLVDIITTKKGYRKAVKSLRENEFLISRNLISIVETNNRKKNSSEKFKILCFDNDSTLKLAEDSKFFNLNLDFKLGKTIFFRFQVL